jgi:hypothetical protein
VAIRLLDFLRLAFDHARAVEIGVAFEIRNEAAARRIVRPTDDMLLLAVNTLTAYLETVIFDRHAAQASRTSFIPSL